MGRPLSDKQKGATMTEEVNAEQLAKRVLVLTNQLGFVARDVQKYVVQYDTDLAPHDDEEWRLIRAELDDDLADLIVQVQQLCDELGYDKAAYDRLVVLG